MNFETSCKPEAQKLFNQGMLYQHSFWYRASQNVFEEVLKADPQCGIAYWGIALSLLWNPHVPTPAKNLAEGAAMIAKGKSLGAGTQRERDYLDALGVMYADFDKVDHRTRIVAYAKAMEQLAQRYPNDDEAQIHYALRSILRPRPPTRLMPTRSKARRSWNRSQNDNRNIPVSRTT